MIHSNLPETPPEPHFLDSLSKIWLTKGALQELNRRTRPRPVAPLPQHAAPAQQRRRPLTRAFLRSFSETPCSTSTPASRFLERCRPESVERVRQYSRYGGPDLRDLRGYLPPGPQHPTTYTTNSSLPSRGNMLAVPATGNDTPTAPDGGKVKITNSSGAYDANFRQRMVDSGIYPHGYAHYSGEASTKPNNWSDLQQMLAVPRRSLSPSVFSEAEFSTFAGIDALASEEGASVRHLIPTIQGANEKARHFTCSDVPFNNLAKIMDGRPHHTKPDVYYGAEPHTLDSHVREQLSNTVVPCTTTAFRPIAPNLFIEAKGPNGSAVVLLNQACYDGAFGARGMHSLHTYGRPTPVYNGNAYTFSVTYYDGVLKLYTHHISPPKGLATRPKYFMNQIKAVAVTDSHETFVAGLTAFRNARAWTKAQRDAAIAAANNMVHMANEASGSNDVKMMGADDHNNDDDLDNEDGNDNNDAKAGPAVPNPIAGSISLPPPPCTASSSRQPSAREDKACRVESQTPVLITSSRDPHDRRARKLRLRLTRAREKLRGAGAGDVD